MNSTRTKMDQTGLEAVCELLADTNKGLTGSQIISFCKGKASDYNVTIPIETTNFAEMGIPNKRTALRMNLEAFEYGQQLNMIDELSWRKDLQDNGIGEQVRAYIQRRYGHRESSIISDIQTDAPSLLKGFPNTNRAFESANNRVKRGEYSRETLDSMRFVLEQLLQEALDNGASLENNKIELGRRLKDRGISKEVRGTITTLISHYSNYQNNHVKHHDDIREGEYRFIIDMTFVVVRFIASSLAQHET